MTPYSWKWILQELVDDLMHSRSIMCQQLPLQYKTAIVPTSTIMFLNASWESLTMENKDFFKDNS